MSRWLEGSRMSSDPTAAIDLRGRLALRPPEAARALGISERKLRELLPQIPHARLGGVVVIPVELLRAWVQDQARSEGNRVEESVREILEQVGSRR